MSNIKDNLNNSNVSESPSELSDVTSPLLEKGAIIAEQEYHEEKQKNKEDRECSNLIQLNTSQTHFREE